jgi:hypothetical protein
MLRSIDKLSGFKFLAEDGEYGKVDDFYINHEENWTIPYLVVSTGHWIFGRRFLIPTSKIGIIDLDSRFISVSLTIDQMKSTENLDAAKRLSHQQGGRIKDVIGKRVCARDGGIGRVDDFIIEQEDPWLVRSLIVNIGKGFISKKVVIASLFIELISFRKSTVYINLLRDTIQNSPKFDSEEHINKELDIPLYNGSAVNLFTYDDKEKADNKP